MSENTMPENTAPEAGTPEVQSPDAGTPEIQTPDQHQMRRKMKLRARKVVKGHYALLVLLCLIAIFFGTEFTSIKTQNDNFHKLITGQEIDVGGSSFKAGGGSSHAEVFNDILENDVDAGKEQADKTTEEYKKTKLTGNILGRRKGLLAPIVNTYSSGHLYLTVVSAINNATKSQTAAVTLFIILSMLISAFIWIVVNNMIGAVLRRAFLEARLYSEVPTGHLMHFKTVKRWMRTARTLFVTDLFLALWRLTIVGAFIKHYSYFLVPYIVAENPDIRTLEAITLSRRMMDGHKWECFKLEMSFLGWFLLGSLTFGLSEVFWSLPYRVATCTEYYTKMRELAQEKEIELSEKLNDYYLYNRAEEAFLRECYPDIEEQKHYIDEHRITLTGAHGFLVKNFGLWIGHTAEKEEYEKLDSIRAQIAEERAAIKGRVYPMRLNPLMDAAKTLSLRALRFLRSYTLWSMVLAFFTFSLVGWLWEVGIHLVEDGIFVNRGCLHGPWLPIYGGGLVMILIVLNRFRKKPLLEIVLIIVLCGIVEFFTSYFLELSSGMRWWDYSGYFLNLNGRICAEGLMVFALGGSVVVYLVMPLFDNVWARLKRKLVIPLCIALLALFVADIVYSHYVPNVGAGITDYEDYQSEE